ncbi:MAG: 16S rRNA (guanine(966)-N(2))-methyltransferase RsmD [Bacilli bacterium]|nr:16S rRNA (guanine(966)-N(2))-methyltransferase RsmD [Bacilli bacterium]
MIKVVGGTYRSRILKTPNDGTEPTKSMVRQAVASSLSDLIEGGTVLDLFAGSGAMGIEMLSRGADKCVFVDQGREQAYVILENLATLKERRGVVLNKDYKAALDEMREQFDIVIIDPPYKMKDAYTYSVSYLLENNLLKENSAVVLEYEGEIEVDISKFDWSKKYNYGRTNVLIVRKRK